jgi:hypothetical protein
MRNIKMWFPPHFDEAKTKGNIKMGIPPHFDNTKTMRTST